MSFVIISFIVVSGIAGIVWAWFNYSALNKMEVEDVSKID